MYETAGIRHQRSLFSYMSADKIISLSHVHRFGAPLAVILQQFLPKLQFNQSITTEFKH